ncbi:hypothetical protein GOBAR_AA28432 [Gossypium barbadense]|uniref:Uncharacterized protein n=1 Tax=Gossypium barbadense TaxID=3634 RepID=A0A2P5WMC0_GOSBA|nr:hypothetical protein GOBAR_AA28432 [Gossypium barbadense]
MLSKFISVSETHFQNTETALKNQQASIQGLETQIGQLSKLTSERLQGSLPSNTEPNPREHLNAISTQNKDGLIIPEPEIQQNNATNKRREEVNDNDPKQVGDTVLLDVVDPHIVTTTPNKEISLTVLSIFPFGTVKVSHPKFSTFKRNTGVGMETHECARDKARFCFFDTGMRHARAAKPWTTIHGRGTLTWAGEKRTKLGTAVRYGRVPHTPKTHGHGRIANHDLKLQDSKHMGSPSYVHGRGLGCVALPFISKSLFIFSSFQKKSLAKISSSPIPDPYSQPPLPSRPVHVAALYADISEHLTRFKL